MRACKTKRRSHNIRCASKQNTNLTLMYCACFVLLSCQTLKQVISSNGAPDSDLGDDLSGASTRYYNVGVMMASHLDSPFDLERCGPAVDLALELVNDKYLSGHNIKLTKVMGSYPSCSGAHAPGIAADMHFRDNVIAFVGPACAFALEPVAGLAAYWNTPIITGLGDQPPSEGELSVTPGILGRLHRWRNDSSITRRDDMPNFICQLCHTQLETSYKFQMQILQSEKKLRRDLQLHASDIQIKSESFIQTPIEDPFTHNIDPDITVKCEYLELPDVPTNPVNIVKEEVFIKSELNDELMDDSLLNSTESAENTVENVFEFVDLEISSENIKTDSHTPERNPAKIKTKKMHLNQRNISNVGFDVPPDSEKNKHKQSDDKIHQCDVCNANFNRSGNLKRHRRIHTGEKPHQCDVCSMCFVESSDLKKHQRIHTREKPYRCDLCDKCFSQQGTLNAHKHTHTGEKLYRCDLCDKNFGTSGTLTRHQRIHTGERPHQCDVCNMTFKEPHDLKRHQRKHTGEKRHQCDVCKKCFYETGHLNFHKRTHTDDKPYKCDLCNKCFTIPSYLNAHKRTHTGEKPFQCDVCDKRFFHSRGLKTHKLQHS